MTPALKAIGARARRGGRYLANCAVIQAPSGRSLEISELDGLFSLGWGLAPDGAYTRGGEEPGCVEAIGEEPWVAWEIALPLIEAALSEPPPPLILEPPTQPVRKRRATREV